MCFRTNIAPLQAVKVAIPFGTSEPLEKFQKLSRKPNCNLRIGPAEEMTPKVADVVPEGTEAPGCPRFTLLKMFVPSARKRSLKRSLKLKSREIAKSTSR